jgi:hypothetical protein
MPDEFSFEQFSGLDGLVVTQASTVLSSRIVILSSVSSDTWRLRLGSLGEGRWWEGIWSEEDVYSAIVRFARLMCMQT